MLGKHLQTAEIKKTIPLCTHEDVTTCKPSS